MAVKYWEAGLSWSHPVGRELDEAVVVMMTVVDSETIDALAVQGSAVVAVVGIETEAVTATEIETAETGVVDMTGGVLLLPDFGDEALHLVVEGIEGRRWPP
eukprot:scpid36922/ scgid3088/ 